ncbi:P2Y purinoceptor 13-like isoform X2 [Brachyhypopomus gauderio]|uniref:P2Y purinoceptor 13-like isoform X2 n=1 Tax=Brachyhypopomus gauderio TaxID=698409 RepID=UPI004041E72D
MNHSKEESPFPIFKGLMASLTVTTVPPDLVCGINGSVRDTVISSLYFILFLPALLLNVVVVCICVRLKSKSTFMVYLKHLVAADLFMTLTFPVRGASELPGAPDGLRAFACRFSSVFFYLSMNASVILMGLISLDRFFKIVRPGGKLLCQGLLFSKLLSASVWVILVSCSTIPIIITSDQDPRNKSGEFCMAMKTDMGRYWHKVVVKLGEVIFWTVCILIMFSYTCIAKKVLESYQKSRSSNDQGKRKAKVRVFLILLVFLVCYAPYNCVRIPYTKLQVLSNDSCTRAALKIAKDVTLWISATNVCLDPLIYFFLCKSFRKKFQESWAYKTRFLNFGKNVEAYQSSDTSL